MAGWQRRCRLFRDNAAVGAETSLPPYTWHCVGQSASGSLAEGEGGRRALAGTLWDGGLSHGNRHHFLGKGCVGTHF